MNKTVLILIFALIFAVSNAAAQKLLCFENQGLKEIHRISFKLKGKIISEGIYETMGYDTDTSTETFKFSGTKTGNRLTIKFARTIPYERPPRTKAIVWTLSKNVLKVPTYGKNYETDKFTVYTADYEPCRKN